jgi:hypothetical protein
MDVALPVGAGLFLLIERARLASPWLQMAQIGMLLVVYGMMAAWVQATGPARERQRWDRPQRRPAVRADGVSTSPRPVSPPVVPAGPGRDPVADGIPGTESPELAEGRMELATDGP